MKSNKINPQAPESEKKAMHLMQARNFFLQARSAVEQDHDWQSAGSLILQGLAEERKAQNSKVQVVISRVHFRVMESSWVFWASNEPPVLNS